MLSENLFQCYAKYQQQQNYWEYKPVGWVGRVRCLGQSPKQSFFGCLTSPKKSHQELPQRNLKGEKENLLLLYGKTLSWTGGRDVGGDKCTVMVVRASTLCNIMPTLIVMLIFMMIIVMMIVFTIFMMIIRIIVLLIAMMIVVIIVMMIIIISYHNL